MVETPFDAWTRRRFGIAAGGALAALVGLWRLDEADAKNTKARRRRKRQRKQRRREKRRDNTDGGPPVDHPDILVVYVDDMREDDYAALPQTRALLAGQGATYPNYFVTTPLCAPSRASFFRGQYAHNTGVRNNQDGYPALNAIDGSTVATWLRGASPAYRTAHVGKHINGYNAARNRVGPGWTDWVVPAPVAFYDYDLNVNGTPERHGNQSTDYLTDVLLAKAREIVATTPEGTPLFLYFAPKSPHGPSTPAPRHENAPVDPLDTTKPSFNEEAPAERMDDKPEYMQRAPLADADVDALRRSNRLRQRSLLSVDEAIEGLIEALGAAGRLDKTYVFFVTDNGYLLGEHRRTAKNVPYEEAIRISMLLRGPGVRHGTNHAFVANIDLAPTIADLAGVAPPGYVDGRSIVETFDGSGNDRRAILIEMFNPGADPEEDGSQFTPEARLLEAQAAVPSARRAIRTADRLYAENAGDAPELYDLTADPFQLQSRHDDPAYDDDRQRLGAWLATLRDCDAGACRSAENGPPR